MFPEPACPLIRLFFSHFSDSGDAFPVRTAARNAQEKSAEGIGFRSDGYKRTTAGPSKKDGPFSTRSRP